MSTPQNRLIQDLFLLQRVAQQINSNLDLDSLLEAIVSDVSETFGYSRTAVLLKDDSTNELVIAAVRGWTINYHLKGDRFRIGSYGMSGHVAETGETYYAPDVSADPYYQVSEGLTRSEVDIPLKAHGRLIGVFNAQSDEIDGFPQDRLRLLEALAGHIATAIENARMFRRERLEKEQMVEELGEARRIQLSLFPERAPDISPFTVSGLCLPCQEVGGDWYDYIPLWDGRLGMVLADVSGKGMGAALLMSSTRAMLRLVAENGSSPGEVLGRVNNVLLRDLPTAKFVTMVYAILDPVNRTLVFASAGHLHPLLVDSAGPRFLETSTGFPLGIMEGTFSEHAFEIPAGSRLFLYSDGVTEALNASGEQYGEERLRNHLAGGSASLESLLNDVRSFAGGFPASDDLTILMIRAPEPTGGE